MNSSKVYLCGDSHANYVMKQFSRSDRNIIDKHQTLGGYGICSFFDENSLRRPPKPFLDGFNRFLNGIEKSSIILFSSFDPDIRLGSLGDRFNNDADIKESFSRYINEAINKIDEMTQFQHLIFLDLYPILPDCSPITVSKELRIKTRDFCHEICSNAESDRFSFITLNRDGKTHCPDSGLVLNPTMVSGDRIHLNIEYSDNIVHVGKYIEDLIRSKIEGIESQ